MLLKKQFTERTTCFHCGEVLESLPKPYIYDYPNEFLFEQVMDNWNEYWAEKVDQFLDKHIHNREIV